MGGEGKSWLLTEYASRGVRRAPITDPIGAELTVYRETADELEREIRLVFDRLAAERAPSPE
jgi:protein-tyrosine-phosphatase